MTSAISDPVRGAWRRFNLELELARHYKLPPMLSCGAMPTPNPVLEYLLPTLLHIKAVALLDEALIHLISARQLTLPKKYGDSLNGRINFLKDQGIISNAVALHAIRNRRNGLAHEGNTQTNWDEMGQDVDEIQTTLEFLGLVGTRPSLEYYGHQSATRDSDEPDKFLIQDYKCGIKENGAVAIEFSWRNKMNFPPRPEPAVE